MSTALEQRLQEQAVVDRPASNSISQLIERMRPELERAMPAYFNADRLLRIALTMTRSDQKLQRCSAASLLGALVRSAQLGLEPGPDLGQVWLIPKTIDNELQVLWLLGYRGVHELMMRHERVLDINWRCVWRGEHFVYREGLQPILEHEPRSDLTLDFKTRENFVAGWLVATLATGGQIRHVIYGDRIDRATQTSALGPGRGPWLDDFPAMAFKTILIDASKVVPMSAEARMAIALDGSVAPAVSPGRPIPQLEDGEPARPAIIDEPQPAPPASPSPARPPAARPTGAAPSAAPSSPPADPGGRTSSPVAPPVDPAQSADPAVGLEERVGELVAFFGRHDEGKTFQGKLTASVAKGYLEAGGVDELRDDEGPLTAVIMWAVCKRRTDIPGRSGTLSSASKGDLRIEGLAGDEDAMAELLVERLRAWAEGREPDSVAWLENVRPGGEESAAVAAGFRPVAERIPGIWLYVLVPKAEPEEQPEQSAQAGDEEVAAREAAAAARAALTLHVANLIDLCPQPLFERMARALRRLGLIPDVTTLAARFPELADAQTLEPLVVRLEGAREFQGFIEEQGQSQETLE